MTRKRKGTLYFAIIILITIMIFIANLIMYNMRQNKKTEENLIFGVDVSKYQGKIDFDLLYSQGARFVFIKATEGTEHIDENFYANFDIAKNSKMRYGAYHFFRFELDGRAQAEHFIENLGDEEGMLPPALDVELYGEYLKNPPPVEETIRNLDDFLERLRETYDQNPIIYCNLSFYEKYIHGQFKNCDIWIASLDKNEPQLYDGRDWTFWQYSHKGVLDGYDGNGHQKYIDFNYFNGDMEDLINYGKE